MLAELGLLLFAPCRLFLRLCRAVPAEGWRHVWKRIPLFMLVFLAYSLLNLLHIAGHVLDEILFRSYRRIRIDAPVFIIGVPRSGTTLLQRILAEDCGFTTLQTWEALLAPSVSERYLFGLLGRLLRPCTRLVAGIRQRLFRQMDQVHEIRLTAAEEDFLLLLPLDACFVLVLLCPDEKRYWNLAAFDSAFDPTIDGNHRRLIMRYYRRCLQKHLYFHARQHAHFSEGSAPRLLSKNPSFTPFIESLEQTFPDARFIACVRPPREVIPSQLDSLRPVMGLLADGHCNPRFEGRLTAVLKSYYAAVGRHMQKSSFTVLPLQELQNNLLVTVTGLLQTLDMPLTENFRYRLEQYDAEARSYRRHYPNTGRHPSTAVDHLDTAFSPVWPLRSQTRGDTV